MANEVTKPDFSYQWSSGGSIVAPSNVKIQTGWTAEVPPFQWENWSQNRQDNAILHLFQKGISEWDAASNYYFTASGTRSYVQGSDGLIYVAVQDNLGQNPVTDTTNIYWRKAFASPADTRLLVGVVGAAKNVRMSLAAASASATLTADEIIVKTSLGGSGYILPSFSKTINLATTGAGGMDVGTAPVSGFVSVYAIYNPLTLTSALLACAQATSNGSVYTGANMPSGYTASALVSSWYTTAAGLLGIGNQRDRTVSRPQVQVSNTNLANQPVNLSFAVPLNAIACSGFAHTISGVAGGGTFAIASDASGSGAQNMGIAGVGGGYLGNYNVLLITPQIFYLNCLNNSTALGYVTGYTF